MEKVKTYTIENNEEFLRQVSIPVDFEKDNIKEIIKLLEDYFNQCDLTLALATIQLGIPKRIIYLKNTNLDVINRKNFDQATKEDEEYNERKILINPKIIKSEGLTEYWEACASCLNNTGLLRRPYKILVEYFDEFGLKHRKQYEGFESTVLSHEIDHLDGILHIDKAEKVLVMTPDERKEFRKTHDYEIIHKDGDYHELLKRK